MQPIFDLAHALRRLEALIQTDPRDALEQVVAHDPLGLLPRAAALTAEFALLIDPAALVIATYEGLLKTPADIAERAGNLQRELEVHATHQNERSPNEAVVRAVTAAIGVECDMALLVTEALRARPIAERRLILSLLRTTSPKLRTLWPGERADLKRDRDIATAAWSALRSVLRTVLSAPREGDRTSQE
ncbi:MAG: hypothetical protein R3F49_12180 [Planctomycetota bacterium]